MDTLRTLDLEEKPDQKITWFHHVKHFQEDQRVDVQPDETVLSCGPHHGHYSYMVGSPREPERK